MTQLTPGLMYMPTGIARDPAGDSVYVVEQFNHRISKWDYNPAATPPANFTFTLDAGHVTSITVTNGGTGYSVADPVDISAPTLNISNPVNATAEVATETAGVIDTITVTNTGNGYDPNNLPTVTATTGGSGAILAAVVSTPFGNNGDGTTGQPGQATGTTDNNLFNPTTIHWNVDRSLFVVTDTFNNRVREMNTSGTFTNSFGTGGRATDGTNFYHPTGISADDFGNTVTVCDEKNHRCMVYDSSSLAFFSVLASPTPVPYNAPHGISTISTSNQTVMDSVNGIISIYDDQSVNFDSQTGAPGTEGVGLFYPSGGDGDSNQAGGTNIFADTRNNSIKAVSGGPPINLISNPGTGNGQLHWPEYAIAFVDTGDYLLVANTRNNRIEVFDDDSGGAVFQSSFGAP